MTKIMLLYLIAFIIVALFAPMPQAQPKPQPQYVIVDLYYGLNESLAGRLRIFDYV